MEDLLMRVFLNDLVIDTFYVLIQWYSLTTSYTRSRARDVLHINQSDWDPNLKKQQDCGFCLYGFYTVRQTVISYLCLEISGQDVMPTFEQEWISPILEVYKKRKITENYSVILGLNPLGQALCRKLYENNEFETVLLFNSPAFSSWNRYPIDLKPPVVPVHGMVTEDLMIIFGDVMFKEYDWMTDLLFYLRGNVPTRFVISLMSHDGPTCGQVLSKKGDRLLKRMEIPLGRSDYYDGITAPLISAGSAAGLDPVVLFFEESRDREIILQVNEVTVTQGDVDEALMRLKSGLDFQLAC
ncbi:MAG: hypothetical protein ThorAB25_07370 [Candidatus Thorarchaeota archaeon AB_25]|nr:MAG: hypothetical protein ThorAB25_07370 [Candidatus Thorarchaeota archaeon AB_25]